MGHFYADFITEMQLFKWIFLPPVAPPVLGGVFGGHVAVLIHTLYIVYPHTKCVESGSETIICLQVESGDLTIHPLHHLEVVHKVVMGEGPKIWQMAQLRGIGKGNDNKCVLYLWL